MDYQKFTEFQKNNTSTYIVFFTAKCGHFNIQYKY